MSGYKDATHSPSDRNEKAIEPSSLACSNEKAAKTSFSACNEVVGERQRLHHSTRVAGAFPAHAMMSVASKRLIYI